MAISWYKRTPLWKKILLLIVGFISAYILFWILILVFGYYRLTSPLVTGLREQKNVNQPLHFPLLSERRRPDIDYLQLEEVPETFQKMTLLLEDPDFLKRQEKSSIIPCGRTLFAIFSSQLANNESKLFLDGSSIALRTANKYKENLPPVQYKGGYRTNKLRFVAEQCALTHALVNELSADELLELFFNETLYTKETPGLQPAARFYFNKPVADLTLAEQSVLVSLTLAPERMAPNGAEWVDENEPNWKSRARYTLDKAAETGVISGDERTQAVAELDELQMYFNDRYPGTAPVSGDR